MPRNSRNKKGGTSLCGLVKGKAYENARQPDTCPKPTTGGTIIKKNRRARRSRARRSRAHRSKVHRSNARRSRARRSRARRSKARRSKAH